ncbi:prevent-host-death protein [Chelatococcus daeguensis]|jgi:prevent-host-death family protein|uniref:Antitoxin n=1 Tax=Chelatococcus daeguensis TaxID=444444 RepID=A0AAC9JMW9_9HYPH|nr:type II toxin-antitoxin system Phd/YefM family antitoxin [Chelatococcus daeguensis]APF36702.1 prevent-host-death protein [Chelatococcus daeguensis]
MKAMSAREAKHQFGRLIDTARAEPVVVEKHGRPVVVVLAVEEFERIKTIVDKAMAPGKKKTRG